MTLHYACIHGKVKLVIFDERTGSSTKGRLMELFLGPDNYCLVVIPPDLWNGFKGMGSEPAIIADLIDIPPRRPTPCGSIRLRIKFRTAGPLRSGDRSSHRRRAVRR